MAEFFIKWFDSVDSTNVRLAEEKGSVPSGTVYAARHQTAGRGQQGNSWHSREGENLTFSILLRPENIPAAGQFSVSQAAAIGVADYLRTRGLNALVKWPNDIYVGDRKICGMLIETSLWGSQLGDVIIGIGLNVNEKEFDPNLPNPTSMSLETGKTFELEQELRGLLDCLGRRLDSLCDPYSRTSLDGLYLESLYRRGQWHWFEELPACDIPTEKRSGRRVNARILGIDNAARLLLEHSDGTLHHYYFKEVKFLI